MPTAGGLVISCRLWYATDKGAADKRQAVSPWSGLTRSGALLALRSHERGAWLMVTYSDLIQIGILIVSLLSLFVQITKK